MVHHVCWKLGDIWEDDKRQNDDMCVLRFIFRWSVSAGLRSDFPKGAAFNIMYSCCPVFLCETCVWSRIEDTNISGFSAEFQEQMLVEKIYMFVYGSSSF